MNPKLTKELIDKYPELYADHTKPPTESLMCFGFECGDGWYDIIDNLSRCIKNQVDSRVEHEIIMREILSFWKIFVGFRRGWRSWWWYKHVWTNIKEYIRLREPLNVDYMQVRAVQVKEKFGGLRFYIHNGSDYIFGLIDMAEMISYKTCEKCGKPGSLHRRGGWLKTVCTKCATPIEYKKAKSDS
jgi:hypothetical protein